MSDRDDLAKVIAGVRFKAGTRLPQTVLEQADAILAAGYRKPRTVTTVEELDALQIGSVAIDAHGDCFQRIEDADGNGDVVWAGDFMYASSSYLALPATVLHELTP